MNNDGRGFLDHVAAGKPEDLIFNYIIRPVNSDFIPIEPVPKRESSASLLDTIPAELQQLVLLNFDLNNLAALRFMNYSFKTKVDFCLQFTRIMAHAPQALIALCRTKTSSYHAIGTIYLALISNACAFCQEFGPLHFLLTCQRSCLNCTLRNPAT